jgi:hypothetical protein
MSAAPRRSDATENRERIIEVARAVLAESDDVRLNAIAKRAGVGQVKRGVLAAVETGVWRELVAQSHGPIGDALTLLLDAGKAAGAFRADVDARDVVLLMGFLGRLERDEWDARARPLMRVVLDGVRRRGTPQ